MLIWSIGLNNIYPVYHVYLQEAFFTVYNFYPSKKPSVMRKPIFKTLKLQCKEADKRKQFNELVQDINAVRNSC